MNDEVRELEEVIKNYINTKLGLSSICYDDNKEWNALAQAILKDYVRRERIDISDKDLGQIVLFIRHSLFLPENKKLMELKKMILNALHSQGGGKAQNE